MGHSLACFRNSIFLVSVATLKGVGIRCELTFRMQNRYGSQGGQRPFGEEHSTSLLMVITHTHTLHETRPGEQDTERLMELVIPLHYRALSASPL